MKKVFALLLTSVLVLGACSNGGAEQKSDKVNESKVQYKNNTVVLNQAVLYIKDVFILKNQDNGKKEIVFKYEVKNKTDKEEITPSNVFGVATQVKQDNGSTVDNLNTGMSLVPNGKYKEWLEHSNDTIKKGKTAKGMSGYQLKNDNKVTVKFTQGAGGKDLGEKVYDLSKLKTVDYSTSDDANNAANETSDNSTQNDQYSNDNVKVSEAAQTIDSKQSNDVQQAEVNTQQPITQEQMEANAKVAKQHGYTGIPNGDAGMTVPQGPTSSRDYASENGLGGHPSAFGKSDVPVGVEKKDSNGDTYIDATGE